MASQFIKLCTGIQMPIVGLGTSAIKEDKLTQSVVYEAIKAGYRHIDTASAYCNEKQIGDALRDAFETKIVKRQDMFMVTKLPGYAHHPEKVKGELMKSLDKLQLSYIDLYLIHSPMTLQGNEEQPWLIGENGKVLWDDEADMVDTWKAMEKVVDEGLAKSIGLSNYNSEQLKIIYDGARIKPTVLQVECHPYFQQEKLLDICRDLNVVLTAYAPIGSPGYQIKMKSTFDIQDDVKTISVLEDPVITSLAKKHNRTTAQICLRFLMQRGIAVIPKSISPNRLRENFQVFDFQLSEDEMTDIKNIDRNFRIFTLDVRGLGQHPRYPFNIPF